jgi:hypothetical protein
MRVSARSAGPAAPRGTRRQLGMTAWIVYALFPLSAPHMLHHPANDFVVTVNARGAFALELRIARSPTRPPLPIVKDVFP